MVLTRHFLIIVFLTFVVVCRAQSQAASDLESNNPILERYVAEVAPDYALFNSTGSGLIRKGDKWSVVRLLNLRDPWWRAKTQEKLDMLERVIPNDLAHQILLQSSPDSLFSIGQERFDALPKKCEDEPGKKRGIYGVADAETIIIWEYTPKGPRKIEFYAAEEYYLTCYPRQREYEILGSLLNTFKVLEEYSSYVQKPLSEYAVKSTLLEQVDPSSIPDIQAYQASKFKSPRGIFFPVAFVSNDYNGLYRLKGHDDLVLIAQRLNDEMINDWEKTVLRNVALYTDVSHTGHPRFEDRVETDEFQAHLFFTRDYKISNANFILYQDKKTKLTLFITYISNLPDEVKITTMRDIVKDIKFH